MKIFFFFSLFLLSCQDYNSNTGDRDKYGEVSLENNAQFRRAYSIIQNRCVNCHTSSVHDTWASYTTNEMWIKSGSNRVLPGRAQDSNLIIRIINSGHTNSNMPIGGSALPNDEYDALVEWIDNL